MTPITAETTDSPGATHAGPPVERWLTDVPLREEVELVRIDLPHDQIEPLLERGMLPGCRICPVRRSPFGDPIVMVDGSLIALRREMAGCLCVRQTAARSGTD